MKAIVHNHLEGSQYNHIGTFSPNDILEFVNMITSLQNQLVYKKKELATYLVCNEGNYALKISNNSKLYNFALKYSSDPVYKRLVNKFYVDNKISHGESKDDQNIGFLKLIQNFDIGIKLYESDDSFTNWEELKLNRFNSIIKNPC